MCARARVTQIESFLVRRIEVISGLVTTIAGKAGVAGSSNGVGEVARFAWAQGVAIDPLGTFAIVVSGGSSCTLEVSYDKILSHYPG